MAEKKMLRLQKCLTEVEGDLAGLHRDPRYKTPKEMEDMMKELHQVKKGAKRLERVVTTKDNNVDTALLECVVCFLQPPKGL